MRLRRLTTLTAVTMLAPALAVIPLPATGQSQQKPVRTTTETAPLVDPSDPAVGDGDYASGQDIAVAKDKTPEVADETLVVLGATGRQTVDPELAVIGVTWSGTTPLAVQYRTEGPEGWGPWQGVDTDSDGDGAEASGRARSGSDPIVVTGATAVQARILGAVGDAPRDPELSVIDPGEGTADETAGEQAGAAQAAASRPYIRSRAAWGADESIRKGSPSYGVTRGVVVHHTAGTNNYSPGQVPAILRGIYAFHVKDRGWSDIGYNFLVDKWGRIWEGRYGGTNRSLMGAHASGFNGVTFGISVMGDYRNVRPSSASIDAVTRVIAWKASIHGFDPRGHFWFKGHSYRNVSGHRDVGNTSCPGSIYDYLPSMASRAQRLRGSVGNADGAATPGTRPPASKTVSVGVQASDALMLGSTGRLFAVAPNGGGISFARQIAAGNWRGYDRILASSDLTGDRRPDVVTRDPRSGRLYIHPGTSGGVAPRRFIGGGWTVMDEIIAPGDWNGDGRADLLAVEKKTGHMILFTGRGNARFSRAGAIGNGWGAVAHIAAPGDVDGDRRPDLLGVMANGAAYVYRGDGRGGWVRGGRYAVGSASGYDTLTGLTGSDAVLAVRSGGTAAVLSVAGRTLTATNVEPNFRGLRVFAG